MLTSAVHQDVKWQQPINVPSPQTRTMQRQQTAIRNYGQQAMCNTCKDRVSKNRHDSVLAPQFHKGLVLKHNVNQRYATNAVSAALFR